MMRSLNYYTSSPERWLEIAVKHPDRLHIYSIRVLDTRVSLKPSNLHREKLQILRLFNVCSVSQLKATCNNNSNNKASFFARSHKLGADID